MRSLALVALLSGCAPSVPVYMTRHSDTFSNHWIVDNAVLGVWGVPVEYRDGSYGTVMVDFVNTEDDVKGLETDDVGCIRHIRGTASINVMAHEFGHAMGLEHHRDLENVMNISFCPRVRHNEDWPIGGYVEDWQLDDFELGAGVLDACVPG